MTSNAASAFLADAVVLLHVAFIAYAIAGGWLTWKWPRSAYVHLPCAAWAVLISFGGWVCPLTPLEWRLREAAGESVYDAGFVEHYIIPLVYPEGLTHAMQIGLGVGVLVINLLAYGGAFIVRRRHSRDEGS